MKIPLKGIVEDKDRHGNIRVYYRKAGKPKVRLREPFGTAAFMDEYRCADLGIAYEKAGQAARSARPRKPDAARLEHLCQEYYRRAAGDVTELTMYQRRKTLERICAVYGGAPYEALTPKELIAMRDDLAETNGAKNNIVKALGALFSWAMDARIVASNPAHGVRCLYSGDGFHAWTMDEVRQFVARFPAGTKPHRVLVIFLFTGLRVSDVARLSLANVVADRLVIRPGKTTTSSGVVVDIPMLPPLLAEIAATPPGQKTLIVTDYGKPYSVKSFGQKFSDWCTTAGLPHCSAHGLRKIGASLAAELGTTEAQLMAVYGWTTQQQASLYTKSANRRRLSDKGMGLMTNAWTEVLGVPPQTKA